MGNLRPFKVTFWVQSWGSLGISMDLDHDFILFKARCNLVYCKRLAKLSVLYSPSFPICRIGGLGKSLSLVCSACFSGVIAEQVQWSCFFCFFNLPSFHFTGQTTLKIVTASSMTCHTGGMMKTGSSLSDSPSLFRIKDREWHLNCQNKFGDIVISV